MKNAVLESPSLVDTCQNIRWCPVTVEHPFDKNISLSTNNDWVQLVGMDDNCLDEQALLLCPYSEVEWVTWLPSQGETILHIDNMCRIPKQD
jgi:hypothetical protein